MQYTMNISEAIESMKNGNEVRSDKSSIGLSPRFTMTEDGEVCERYYDGDGYDFIWWSIDEFISRMAKAMFGIL